MAKIIKEIFFVDTENIAFFYNKKICIHQIEHYIIKYVLVLLLMMLAIPLNAFAFDIRGWWQLEEMPSIFMKINEEKIYGFKYRISKETDERVEIFVDNSDVPCYLDKKGEDGLLLINALGEQKSYKLVTRDTSLPQKDVRKLCGIEE